MSKWPDLCSTSKLWPCVLRKCLNRLCNYLPESCQSLGIIASAVDWRWEEPQDFWHPPHFFLSGFASVQQSHLRFAVPSVPQFFFSFSRLSLPFPCLDVISAKTAGVSLQEMSTNGMQVTQFDNTVNLIQS